MSAKLRIIGDIDPFAIGGDDAELCAFPLVGASDIVSHLVLQTSFITAQQFKAHKSLDTYNQFTSGWVKEVCAHRIKEICVVTAWVSVEYCDYASWY